MLFTCTDHLSRSGVGQSTVWGSPTRKNLPTKYTKTPDIAEGCVLSVIKRFGCGPFDWDLLHSIRDDVFLLFAGHTKIRDFYNIIMT